MACPGVRVERGKSASVRSEFKLPSRPVRDRSHDGQKAHFGFDLLPGAPAVFPHVFQRGSGVRQVFRVFIRVRRSLDVRAVADQGGAQDTLQLIRQDGEVIRFNRPSRLCLPRGDDRRRGPWFEVGLDPRGIGVGSPKPAIARLVNGDGERVWQGAFSAERPGGNQGRRSGRRSAPDTTVPLGHPRGFRDFGFNTPERT